MSDYKIRKILPKDNKTIAEIIRYNLKNHGLDIPGTVYFDAGLNKLSEVYSSEKSDYFVLVDSNDIVVGGIGFAEFEAFENCAELQKLYIADSAKGSGLGYQLISFVEEKMRDAGFRTSYLETHENLKAAIHIYEKSGYLAIERPASVAHGAMNRFYLKKLL